MDIIFLFSPPHPSRFSSLFSPSSPERQRHPQKPEGLLPAEASGLIAVGDALVGCNGYSLQGMDLEQAVGVMRSVGTPPSGRCMYMYV